MFILTDRQFQTNFSRRYLRQMKIALIFGLILPMLAVLSTPLLGEEIAGFVGNVSDANAETCSSGTCGG